MLIHLWNLSVSKIFVVEAFFFLSDSVYSLKGNLKQIIYGWIECIIIGHFELNAKQPWHESKMDRSKSGKIKPCRNWTILRFNKLDELSWVIQLLFFKLYSFIFFARFLTLALWENLMKLLLWICFTANFSESEVTVSIGHQSWND